MKKLIYIFCSLICVQTQSQTNLVQNPSFEDNSACTSSIGDLNVWSSYRGSPDYFNSCNTYTDYYSVPSNGVGYQSAQEGQAYLGLVAYSTGGEAREYIGSMLSQSLVIGQTYYVTFYASLAEFDAINKQYIPCNKIGARFSTVSASGSDNPFPGTNPVPIDNFAHVYTNSIVSDTLNWVKIQGSFVADSAYQYIMLGNFFDDANTDTIYRPTGVYSYFFLDNICVSTSSTSCELPTKFVNNKLSPDKIKIFPNPVDTYMCIDIANTSSSSVIIYNNVNEEVLNKSFAGNITCDLSEFENGIYFIKILSAAGNTFKKIIINH